MIASARIRLPDEGDALFTNLSVVAKNSISPTQPVGINEFRHNDYCGREQPIREPPAGAQSSLPACVRTAARIVQNVRLGVGIHPMYYGSEPERRINQEKRTMVAPRFFSFDSASSIGKTCPAAMVTLRRRDSFG